MRVIRMVVTEVPGLGEMIREARERDRRSLAKICREINMSTQNWYRIEREEQDLPIDTLRKIETVLGIEFGVSEDL